MICLKFNVYILKQKYLKYIRGVYSIEILLNIIRLKTLNFISKRKSILVFKVFTILLCLKKCLQISNEVIYIRKKTIFKNRVLEKKCIRKMNQTVLLNSVLKKF